MTWLLWLGLVLCLLVVAAVGISAYGSKRWTDATLTLTRGLDAARIDARVNPPPPTRYDSREPEGLPAPVQRYFRAVFTISATSSSLVHLFSGKIFCTRPCGSTTTVRRLWLMGSLGFSRQNCWPKPCLQKIYL